MLARRGGGRRQRWPPRPRSSPGWSGTRTIRSPGRSPGPGHELQHRFATAEPDPAQLEVAEAALAPACLETSSDAWRSNTRQQGKRLPPEIFDLPVEKMREGYYTDAYFNHTRSALLADGRHPRVVMQVFQKHQAVLGGMDEAIAILKLCSDDWDALTVHALYDGDRIEPWETVMTIEGDYTLFAHLETVYLGVLARRTLISTNVDARARGGRAASRSSSCRPGTTTIASRPATATRRTSPARSSAPRSASPPTRSRRGGAAAGIGTVPHALIAAYGGNTVLAATKFAEWAPDGLQHRRARRLRERLGADRRSRSPARSRTASGACGSTRPASSSTGRSGTRWATSTRAA